MKLFTALIAAITIFSAPAHATPVTYNFVGPNFTFIDVAGAFTIADKITGSVTFDSSMFNNTGDLSLYSDEGAISNFKWAFQDGHSAFSNVLTTKQFRIEMRFANYLPSSWNIDPTIGVTPQSDIFVKNQNGSIFYQSYYQNYYADNKNTQNNTSSNWEVARAVPEPASLTLVGLGLLGVAAGRRRK